MRLVTPRLTLRHWTASAADRAAFHRLASDDAVMRYFPYRLTRPEADARLDAMRESVVRNGFGWCAADLADSGKTIGIVGVALTSLPEMFPGAVEIGWRFVPEAWGQGLATEAAAALRDHAFADLRLAEILAFAVTTNAPSLRVMRRIGMVHAPERDFDHPRVPDDRPDLKRHVTYRIAP